jgi:inosine/xanthosine triphosphatase
MKIAVGSKNPTKVMAVMNVLKGRAMFAEAHVVGVDPDTQEFGHPKNISETVQGAVHRSTAAYSKTEDCDYAVGIEGGLMEVPHTKSGYVEVAVCAIFDGVKHHIGTSPGFEWPTEVMKLILAGEDGSQAYKKLGLTSDEKIGTGLGAIHHLTNGAMDRTHYNELALQMALIHLEHPTLYQ